MFVILDVETTGLSFEKGHKIVSLALLKENKERQFFINPGRLSDEGALNIHKLTQDFLKDKPKFDDIADEFLSYINEEDTLVIHNAPFDLSFINGELLLSGRNKLQNKVIDTLALARKKLKGIPCNLDNLCCYYGIDLSEREKCHDSLIDCRLLYQVFYNLLK